MRDEERKMHERLGIVHYGLGFDSVLLLLGIIFCILKGANVLPDSFTWLLCCVPFIIVAVELVIVFVGTFIFALCTVAHIDDDPIIPHDEDDIKEED